MRGNSFGKLFSITSFGESHGNSLGVTIDGVPPNLTFNPIHLQEELKRRAPGQHKTATSRKEDDLFEVLSGIFQDKTLGTPITIIVRNTNQKSQDYKDIKGNPRAGHADQTTLDKFGIKDHRGGGRASGRETLSRVIGGYFAKLAVPMINIKAFTTQIGTQFKLADQSSEFLLKQDNRGLFSFPTNDKELDEIEQTLMKCKVDGESLGGSIVLVAEGIPKGLGEPVFDKLKADFAKGFLSIGSCIGFQIGEFENQHEIKGSELSKTSVNFGGIEGGISNGFPLKITLHFKAPSTVGENAKQGRHDPCILPRVIPVVEGMAAIVLADHYLRQSAYSGNLPTTLEN
jgi:chorismate synthase